MMMNRFVGGVGGRRETGETTTNVANNGYT
uniref:Uncharacterized protein n=1 Tax=Rhizophora mucronata TaxID=61149 RepID=A0A2P2NFH9_RHIMU